MKEKLSFRHMLQLARYYWRTEKHLYLRLYLGLLAIFLFKGVLVSTIGRLLSVDQMGGVFIIVNDEWIFWGFILICMAHMFTALEQKPTSITLLTLPASNLAKFLTRVVYVTIGIFLLALASRCTSQFLFCIPLFFEDQWAVVDILRYQVFPGHWIIASQHISDSASFFNALIIVFMSMMWALWPWSLFTLFGLLFRRNGWLWAIPVLFIGIVLFALAVTNIHFHTNAMLVGIAIIVAFSLLNYWLAYRCFCRAQVITDKPTRL